MEEGSTMKKYLILASVMVLAACGGKDDIKLPPPPKNSEVITQEVPVPVLCTVELEKAKIKLDSMEKGRPLEEQNAAMRETIAQQKSYIIALEAGIIGCGGKIKK
jgi:predicted small lipoprotein YifL